MSDPAPKKLTTLDATLMTMGGIIGIGIFFNPQQGAAAVPDVVGFLSLWIFGGVIALCAAFTFAELGAAIPRTGGWFEFLREAFGRFPAFLFAWVVLGIVSTGATAAVAGFCAGQLASIAPAAFGEQGVVSAQVLASLLILVVTAIAWTGVKRAALVQNLCMVVKLTALAALVVCGFVFLGSEESAATPSALPAASTRPSLSGWFGALLPTFFAYGGWQMVAYIAPEVRDPTRTLPRALILGVLGVVVVYTTANLSFVLVLGVDGLGQDAGFAATIARSAFGENGARALAAGMAVSALGWVIVNILAAPWLYVAMARERLFFQSVGKLHEGSGVPRTALAIQATVSIVYLNADLDFLVSATVFVEWFFHGLVALALMRLRRSRTDLVWPYRSPLYPLAPIVYLIAAVVITGNTLWNGDWKVRGWGMAIVAAGSLAYVVWSSSVARSRTTA